MRDNLMHEIEEQERELKMPPGSMMDPEFSDQYKAIESLWGFDTFGGWDTSDSLSTSDLDYDILDNKYEQDKKQDEKESAGQDKKQDEKHGQDKKQDEKESAGQDKKQDEKHGQDKKQDEKESAGQDKKQDEKHGQDKKVRGEVAPTKDDEATEPFHKKIRRILRGKSSARIVIEIGD